ncbi:large conductance mechanosensitive channel protein MscL [Microbacterium suwonense]|uniref:Large-conductance mechanosensitive channel n=1 Tax=Microbacterium suwonense TaxID=683047 RepID=A0ABM8FQG4_9MICO|nr:large conductance mechanosensitive channel protein MscL [Microbacterium suwonense]BDZ37564.1 large conductance mechanosensitive channel protein MscL [Microbacterium suwonense]
MLKGFKEFIAQGNVIDLAVAVVIGAAFTAIVNTIVEQLINPLIGLLFNAENLDQAFIVEVGSAKFGFGAVIAAIISFLAVALVVYFVFVVPMNKMKELQAARNPAVEEDTLPTEQELLIEIRDALRKNAS